MFLLCVYFWNKCPDFVCVITFSFYFLLKILNNKFGFVNGDCLGFTIEHTELVLLNIALMMVL